MISWKKIPKWIIGGIIGSITFLIFAYLESFGFHGPWILFQINRFFEPVFQIFYFLNNILRYIIDSLKFIGIKQLPVGLPVIYTIYIIYWFGLGAGITFVALKIHEKNKRIKNPKGISGWLIFPTLDFMMTFVFSVTLLLFAISDYYPQSALEIFKGIIIGSLAFITLYFEYKKKRIFVKIAVIVFWINFFVYLTISVINSFEYSDIFYYLISGYGFYLLFSLSYTIAITFYMKKSKRVKNTFTR